MPESEQRPREFSDESGVRWRVRERATSDRPRALYFETDSAFRRVTHYPPDWRDLPTGEVEILSRETWPRATATPDARGCGGVGGSRREALRVPAHRSAAKYRA